MANLTEPSVPVVTPPAPAKAAALGTAVGGFLGSLGSFIASAVSAVASFFTGLLSGAATFLSGGFYWLIAIAVLTAAAFGVGWYTGETHESKIMATAAVSAAQTARAAQSAVDAADYVAAKADYERRLAIAGKRSVVYRTLFKDRKVLVPNPTGCKAPAAAMKALNDPSLIGEGAQ